jgi:sarcosine oxidase delta subunit
MGQKEKRQGNSTDTGREVEDYFYVRQNNRSTLFIGESIE